MKILFTGRGISGSWKIRGIELGAAIGARVEPDYKYPTHNWRGVDLAVLVKRGETPKIPFVYDIVDAYPQPLSNDWSREQSIDWIVDTVRQIKPIALVAATRRMEQDCEVLDLPILTLPHHARPWQQMNPIRERVHSVGYEGSVKWLGSWRPIVERECERRGWRFVLNPETLADVDIVVALREAAGYPARNWKSNVKLANAQATGTPAVLTMEQGYLETQSGAEAFVEEESDLARAFDRFEDFSERQKATRTMLLAAPMLDSIAQKYRNWLEEICVAQGC